MRNPLIKNVREAKFHIPRESQIDMNKMSNEIGELRFMSGEEAYQHLFRIANPDVIDIEARDIEEDDKARYADLKGLE